jgi:hypothetical protein
MAKHGAMHKARQLPRKQIKLRLAEAGIARDVELALAGDQAAVQRLTQAVMERPDLRAELERILPRRSNGASGPKRRRALFLTATGIAGREATLVSGGLPGSKR